MKHIWKKWTSVLLAAACVFALTACGGSKATDESVDPQLEMNLAMMVQGLSESVVTLSEEEIENYKNAGDEFTEGVMEAWEGAREELGELAEFGTPVTEKDGNEYIVTLPGKFEKAEAEFVYMFDRTSAPLSLSVNVNYPMSVNMQRAALNTVMGLGVVFIMLAFLSFIISLFRLIPDPEKKKKEAAPAPAEVPAAVSAAPAAETDDTQLVAVIAAAIAAAEGTDPDSFVVRSIRKVNRRKW